jgi:hypothetical protein
MQMILVFVAIFFILGLVLLLVGIRLRGKAKAAAEWPTTTGTIISASLQENSSLDSENNTQITYEPLVQYQYSLIGQRYVGTRLSFGHMSYDYRTASKKIAAYIPGAQVTVHYDPTDPSQSVLEPKAAGGMVMIILGALFMVIGIAFGLGTLLN